MARWEIRPIGCSGSIEVKIGDRTVATTRYLQNGDVYVLNVDGEHDLPLQITVNPDDGPTTVMEAFRGEPVTPGPDEFDADYDERVREG